MHLDRSHRIPGSYCLLVAVSRPCRISVGALGVIAFDKGFYAYAGSAMGGLRGRIDRHLRKEKRLRWHIDYLLEKGRVEGVIHSTTDQRLECSLAQCLKRVFCSIPGFGSSDCRCWSHLFYGEDLQSLQKEAVVFLKGLPGARELILERYWSRGLSRPIFFT